MTNQLANVLRREGVKRGDRVAIYMPNCPVAVAAIQACARIGAIHRYISFVSFYVVQLDLGYPATSYPDISIIRL